jgi:hypothetical protein
MGDTMTKKRVDQTDVVGKLLVEKHGDFLRQVLKDALTRLKDKGRDALWSVCAAIDGCATGRVMAVQPSVRQSLSLSGGPSAGLGAG